MRIWKEIKGFEDLYEVSSLGEVRSKTRDRVVNSVRGTFLRPLVGRTLKPFFREKHYATVNLSNGKMKNPKMIHRLVAEAFLEQDPQRTNVNHINGNKHDNRVENLQWCTTKENLHHSREILKNKGKVFNYEQIVTIIKLYSMGAKIKDLASLSNVSRQAIGQAVNGKRWTDHVAVKEALKKYLNIIV